MSRLFYRARLIWLLILIAISASISHSQNEGGLTARESFQKAVSLTKSALKSLNSGDSSKATRSIYWTGSGKYDISARLQGLDPAKPDFVPATEVFGFDPASNAVLYEYKTKVNHDANEWIRFVYDGKGRLMVMNPAAKWAIWTSGAGVEDQRRGYGRIIPQSLLSEALLHRGTLRYQGTRSIKGESVDVVFFTLEDNQTISLLFSKRNGAFRGLEYLVDHPLLGDVNVKWLFADFRRVKGFGMLPYKYEVFLGPRLLKSVELKEANASFDPAAYTKSTPDIKIPEPPDPKKTGRTQIRAESQHFEEIESNVYLAKNIRGGFHVLVVEFDKYLMVVDTPAGYHELQQIPAVDWAGEKSSSAVGKRLLNRLRNRFPEKPVKFVVLTHHHSDHAGGIHPFLKKGVTILASKETFNVLDESLKFRFGLDSLDERQKFEFERVEVSGSHTITEGTMKVELRNVGSNPHSEGMLVAYIPRRGLLYQSDLFEPFADAADPSPTRLTIMKWFVRWLDRSNLKPEKIYSIHGSAVVTKKQIERVRAMGGDN